MKKEKLIIMISSTLCVLGASAQTYSVTASEFVSAGGDFPSSMDPCPFGWVTNGNYTRVDVASSVAGTLKSGTTNDGRVEHCGTCPVGVLSLTLTASFSGTNESTKEVNASVSAGNPIVSASLDTGMGWADGNATDISGSATISGIDPCQFQEGNFTFDYYEDKGRQVTHDYSGEAVANSDPSNEDCNHENGDTITANGVSLVSTNLGTHYHSTDTSYQSTVGGTCSGCVSGEDDPDCGEDDDDDGGNGADYMPTQAIS